MHDIESTKSSVISSKLNQSLSVSSVHSKLILSQPKESLILHQKINGFYCFTIEN